MARTKTDIIADLQGRGVPLTGDESAADLRALLEAQGEAVANDDGGEGVGSPSDVPPSEAPPDALPGAVEGNGVGLQDAPPPPVRPAGTANPMNVGAEPDAEGHPPNGLAEDVDRIGEGLDEVQEGVVKAWTDGAVMVADLERHAAKSHGLTSDVELIKKVAAHLRAMFELHAR